MKTIMKFALAEQEGYKSDVGNFVARFQALYGQTDLTDVPFIKFLRLRTKLRDL